MLRPIKKLKILMEDLQQEILQNFLVILNRYIYNFYFSLIKLV